MKFSRLSFKSVYYFIKEKYKVVFNVYILGYKNLGSCETFEKLKTTRLPLVCLLRFFQVSQHPSVHITVYKHGKPFYVS